MDSWPSKEISAMLGEKVVDDHGQKVGTVMQITDRPGTMEPEWLVVKTSRFGRKVNLVPLDIVTAEDHVVHTMVDKEMILSSPHPATPLSLSERDRAALLHHYRMAS